MKSYMQFRYELRKKYDKLENINDHNGAALLLVNEYGTEEEKEILKGIAERHEKRGHILHEEREERYRISQKYYKHIR